MSRGWAVLLVWALFLSGVAVGALGMHLYYFEKHQGSARHGGGPRGLPLLPGRPPLAGGAGADRRSAGRDRTNFGEEPGGAARRFGTSYAPKSKS